MITLHQAFKFSRTWLVDLGLTPREMLEIMCADPLFYTSPAIDFLVELGYTPNPMVIEHMSWTDEYQAIIEITNVSETDYTMFLLKFPE